MRPPPKKQAFAPAKVHFHEPEALLRSFLLTELSKFSLSNLLPARPVTQNWLLSEDGESVNGAPTRILFSLEPYQAASFSPTAATNSSQATITDW
jgi:hypothetical protein